MTRAGAQPRIELDQDYSLRPSVQVQGVGVHSGQQFSVEVFPLSDREAAQLEAPILFTSFYEGVEFSAPALWTRLSGTSRSTALVMRGESRRKLEIRTVEHFLAAAFVLGLKARVEIQGARAAADILEVPILDGACQDWMRILRPVLTSSPTPEARKVWVPTRSLEIQDGSKRVLISPWSEDPHRTDTFFSCSVDFNGNWKQHAEFSLDWLRPSANREAFEKSIAPARTFGFLHEIKALEARGLALGGSLANALVLDTDKVMNPGGFRVENELASHKLLDAVGDFALLGAPLIGRIDLFQAGHSMHLRAIEEAAKTGILKEAWLGADGKLRYST